MSAVPPPRGGAPVPDDGAALTATYHPAEPVDVRRTLAVLARGRGDPTQRADAAGVWRTAWTPAGPGTLRLEPRPGGEVDAWAWGPGAAWLVEGVPELLGARDDPASFRPAHPLLRELHRRHGGLRIPRTRLVVEMFVAAVLEQKVTGVEAHRSWRELVWRFGAPAPGPAPAGMRVAPPAAVWRRIPSWEWHRAGVDGRRSRTIVGAVAHAARLEATLAGGAGQAQAVFRRLPGVGAWTAAEVVQRAHGDADAVSVGDFHIPALVGWALAGRPVDDDGMLRLLEPFRPHRHRAVRLLEMSVRKPRFGPRMTVRDLRTL